MGIHFNHKSKAGDRKMQKELKLKMKAEERKKKREEQERLKQEEEMIRPLQNSFFNSSWVIFSNKFF